MRAIKFRAWHPEWKEMVYSDQVDYYEKREYYPFVFAIGFSHYPQDGQWELMQFTGLKDKNGKEIYEGDVINVYKRVDEFGEHGKVYWGGRYARWMINDYGFIDDDDIEVIGNIHQNPNLIK